MGSGDDYSTVVQYLSLCLSCLADIFILTEPKVEFGADSSSTRLGGIKDGT